MPAGSSILHPIAQSSGRTPGISGRRSAIPLLFWNITRTPSRTRLYRNPFWHKRRIGRVYPSLQRPWFNFSTPCSLRLAATPAECPHWPTLSCFSMRSSRFHCNTPTYSILHSTCFRRRWAAQSSSAPPRSLLWSNLLIRFCFLLPRTSFQIMQNALSSSSEPKSSPFSTIPVFLLNHWPILPWTSSKPMILCS